VAERLRANVSILNERHRCRCASIMTRIPRSAPSARGVSSATRPAPSCSASSTAASRNQREGRIVPTPRGDLRRGRLISGRRRARTSALPRTRRACTTGVANSLAKRWRPVPAAREPVTRHLDRRVSCCRCSGGVWGDGLRPRAISTSLIEPPKLVPLRDGDIAPAQARDEGKDI